MKKGFTLAEVLLTLGIIGVVSAMTVPTLMQNYQRKSYVTQLHKTYNLFNQALLQYQNDRNALNLLEAGLTSGSEKTFLSNYFKIVKDCGTSGAASECFASSYKTLEGKDITFPAISADYSYYKAVLANGTSVSMSIDQTLPDYEPLGTIAVDINGKSGPNIVGRDCFVMYLWRDGVLDEWEVTPDCRKNNSTCAKSTRDYNYENNCQSSYFGCFGKILNDNWEMNY